MHHQSGTQIRELKASYSAMRQFNPAVFGHADESKRIQCLRKQQTWLWQRLQASTFDDPLSSAELTAASILAPRSGSETWLVTCMSYMAVSCPERYTAVLYNAYEAMLP